MGKMGKLFIGSVIFHVFLLFVVFDLYFKSPLHQGMTPHKTNGEAFSKRVALFVIDGLRAESLYEDYEEITPYLTSLRHVSAWGTINTRVPTETRPGHIAILGGIHEDPSAIFTGWQSNLIKFDSLVNQSNHAWSFGSPDVVNIFTKHDTEKLFLYSYSPDYQDFSGETSTVKLDDWVFDEVHRVLTRVTGSCKDNNEMLNNGKVQTANELQLLDPTFFECLINCGRACDIMESDCAAEYVLRSHILPSENDAMINNLAGAAKKCRVPYDPHCGYICSEGNLFFIHLLGMDSVGHIHKPNSREYVANLAAVDSIIRKSVDDFGVFFGDDETTFIVTSDHGMTNWGSHGDGSDHETKVPFIAWGKGVNSSARIMDMEQIDIAPLIASYLGIPIPVNSMGVLKHELLFGTQKQVLGAVFANVLQLAEHYLKMKAEFEFDFLFIEYFTFDINNINVTIDNIKLNIENEDYDEALAKSDTLIKDIMFGLTYMKDYYLPVKLFLVMCGVVLWLASLLLSVPSDQFIQNVDHLIIGSLSKLCKTIKNYMLLTIIFVTIYLYYIGSSLMAYAYFLFPIVTFLGTMNDETIYAQIAKFLRNEKKETQVFQAILIAVMLQIMALGFSDKVVYLIVMLVLPCWFNLLEKCNNFKIQLIWMLCCLALGVCLMLPASNTFSYIGLYSGLFCWCVYYIFIFQNEMKYRRGSAFWHCISVIPLLLTIAAGITVLCTAIDFDNYRGVSSNLHMTSWILTAIAVAMIVIHPTRIVSKFNYIAACLVVPYILMSVGYDIVVYTVLIVLLYYWIALEYSLLDTFMDIHGVRYSDCSALQKRTSNSDYRRTFFFIAIIFTYFFAIGNIASMNGFDPMWTRAYVSVFSKTIMAALIVFKIIIPFFAITCAYFVINNLHDSNDITCFKTIILYLDQMLVSFMLRVRNEGSWKEIGHSLSHFIIIDTMAIVIILFYFIVRYIIR